MQRACHKRLIGVLGGMGPAATIDFMSKIVAATPAGQDQEHVPLIVHDVPQIPDRSTAILSGDDAPFLPMLSGIRLLDLAGVEYVAIPCNTAHFWFERLKRGARAEILHIADAAVMGLKARGDRGHSVAIMATRGTLLAGIYQSRLKATVEKVMEPDEPTQTLIDRSIAAVKAGERDKARLLGEEAAARLLDAGAETLLLACTELPVAFAASSLLPHTLDATDALARACVRASCGDLEAMAEA